MFHPAVAGPVFSGVPIIGSGADVSLPSLMAAKDGGQVNTNGTFLLFLTACGVWLNRCQSDMHVS